MNVAILITCYNRKESTLKCLNYLFGQKGINNNYFIKVFLVDDGSSDGTTEALIEYFPQIYIIKGNGNLYWNRGMYLAWKTAVEKIDFDYYLWLNDDTYLFENAISNLLNISNLKLNKSPIIGSTYSISLKKCSYGGYDENNVLLTPNKAIQEVVLFNGNVVLIPKFVFNTVGFLNNFYPHAIGDFEYSLRVQKKLLKSFIVPDYVGNCEGSEVLPLWCSTSIPFVRRIRNLYSPLGNSHPFYFFIFELKYYNILVALKHLISIHLRLFFPQLWKLKVK